MKGLYKKVAAGVLSSVLLVGASVSASHANLIPEMMKYGRKIGHNVNYKRLPFKSKQDVKFNSKLRALNDAEMIFGFRDLFNYYLESINYVREGFEYQEHNFNYAHDFVEYVSKKGLKQGKHLVKIRGNVFVLDVFEDVEKGFDWILELDKHYLKGIRVQFPSLNSILK